MTRGLREARDFVLASAVRPSADGLSQACFLSGGCRTSHQDRQPTMILLDQGQLSILFSETRWQILGWFLRGGSSCSVSDCTYSTCDEAWLRYCNETRSTTRGMQRVLPSRPPSDATHRSKDGIPPSNSSLVQLPSSRTTRQDASEAAKLCDAVGMRIYGLHYST